jgi:predicted Zn-dependent protease
VLEAFARALFDARRYGEAAERFTELVETSPDNDYARFGLGLSRMRLGDLTAAVEQLALATAMRPGRVEYQQALREARATVRAREDAGLTGPPDQRGGPPAGDPSS